MALVYFFFGCSLLLMLYRLSEFFRFCRYRRMYNLYLADKVDSVQICSIAPVVSRAIVSNGYDPGERTYWDGNSHKREYLCSKLASKSPEVTAYMKPVMNVLVLVYKNRFFESLSPLTWIIWFLRLPVHLWDTLQTKDNNAPKDTKLMYGLTVSWLLFLVLLVFFDPSKPEEFLGIITRQFQS